MSDDDGYMDITPDVHFLQSIRADRGSWSQLIAEGADNSFDADATELNIQLRDNGVILTDNGRGIAKAQQSAIVRLGEHVSMVGTKLGRFGIGIKYNACSAGDLLTVSSRSNDGRMSLVVDWPKIISSGKWRIPKSTWLPSLVVGGTGTTITIERLQWPRPKDKDIAHVHTYLAQTFYPAIEGGARIRLNGLAIKLIREPDLTDIVEQTIQLPNGKGAHVRGGILVDPAAKPYQVHVSYKHRVVMPQSIFGCGEHRGGTRRMFARVTLTADWKLSRFKDDIIDDDVEELEAAVAEVLRPILEKCESEDFDVKVDELTDLLNERLPIDMQPTRPARKRPRGSTTASNRGKRSNGRTKDGHHTPDGPARRPPDRRIIISIDDHLCDEYGYGHFLKGRPNRISLARDNPDIAALLTHRDQTIAIRSLFAIALMIYHHALATSSAPLLPFDEDLETPFGLRVWKTVSLQPPATENSESA